MGALLNTSREIKDKAMLIAEVMAKKEYPQNNVSSYFYRQGLMDGLMRVLGELESETNKTNALDYARLIQARLRDD